MSDKQDLNSKIATWLSQQGYRLEYMTYNAFRKAGLASNLGFYVETPTGLKREIDATAYSSTSVGGERSCLLRVLCECKYSQEHPWVLLQADRSANIYTDLSALPRSSNLIEYADIPDHVEPYESLLCQTSHFDKGRQFAHGIVQAFTKDNKDKAYDALRKISDAAWDFAEVAERRYPPGDHAFIIAIPALIVDGPLFEARFDAQVGAFSVSRVEYGRLRWMGCRDGTAVDVVQAEALDSYAREVKRIMEILPQMVKNFVRSTAPRPNEAAMTSEPTPGIKK